jgi:S-adenosylmethionine decarboxylase
MSIELLRQESSEDVRKRKLTQTPPANQDFFIERDGVRYAGAHLIIDLYDADRLNDLTLMENSLRRCIDVAGATLLHIHLHPFEPNGGISGVAVLAESHISVHTWPERRYAAFDVFMCGAARPERCIEVLLEAFSPRRVAIEEFLRGSAV